ncbi:MAG: hypothetical protein ACOYMR_10380 [Ilumatobacteraceae bacterium]
MRRAAFTLLALIAGLLSLPASGAAHAAGGTTTGGRVLVDPGTAKPGERIRVSVEGFDADYVTVSFCGNEARRGSADCDQPGSKGFELRPDGELTFTEMIVSAPPVPCPCVVRVTTPLNDVVTVAPFVVEGHPVEELAAPAPDAPLVEVTVQPKPADVGVFPWMRASLGGAKDYDVTVSVRNMTNDPLRRVVLDGSVGRDEFDVTTSFDLENPGLLGGGQSFSQTVRVRIPAPTVGSFVWRVSAGGAGPTVTTLVDERPVPWMLIAVLGFLLIDLVLLVMRWRISRRAKAAEAAAAAQMEADIAALLATERGDVVDVGGDELIDVD